MSQLNSRLSAHDKKEFEKQFIRLNRLILESITDIVGIADKEGNAIYINPTIKLIAGYHPNELLGRNALEFAHPDDIPLIHAEREKLFLKKEARFEFRFRKKEGSYIWVDIMLRLVSFAKNKTEYMVFSARNIEQRKQLEAQILHSSKELETLNAIKDKLIYLIAHDLKNPIYNIITLTKFLQNNLGQLPPKEINSFISSVNESANNAYILLENLMEWAKLQSGLMEAKPEQVNVKRIILDNWKLVQVQAEAKKISFRCHVPEQLLFKADFHMFDTIVRNILSNAVKYNSDNGIVEVSASVTDSEFVLRFRDTGIGMSKEQQRFLFQPDSRKQLNKITTGQGSGLGLVLCKEMVDRHNGFINVNSKLGKGTAISIHFPVNALKSQ